MRCLAVMVSAALVFMLGIATVPLEDVAAVCDHGVVSAGASSSTPGRGHFCTERWRDSRDTH